jgi:hypothetical protein
VRQAVHKRISLPENFAYQPGGPGGAAAKVMQQHLHQQRLLQKRQQGMQKPRGTYGERRGSKPYCLGAGGSEFIFQPIAEDEPPSSQVSPQYGDSRLADIDDDILRHQRAASAHCSTGISLSHHQHHDAGGRYYLPPMTSTSNSAIPPICDSTFHNNYTIESESCIRLSANHLYTTSSTTAIDGLPRVMAASCKLTDSPREQSPETN